MALLLLGTTTYAADGFCAVDGAYARVIALSKQPSELRTPYRTAVSAA